MNPARSELIAEVHYGAQWIFPSGGLDQVLGIGSDTLKSILSSKGTKRYSDDTLRGPFWKRSGIQRRNQLTV